MRSSLPAPDYSKILKKLESTLADTPTLLPDQPGLWDLEGRWDEVEIRFVDARFCPTFNPFRHFRSTSIKLVNLDAPAVRVSFHSKHKYWLKKPDDTPREDLTDVIERHLGALHLRRTLLEQEARNRPTRGRPAHRSDSHLTEADLQREIDQWSHIQQHLDEYDVAQSTYERKYTYITVNWKYQLPTGEFANSQEHLLNSTRDPSGQVTKLKTNVIFIDVDHILRTHPNQNKEIEMYLENFPFRSKTGVPKLYARKK